jgi:hypothetical protein
VRLVRLGDVTSEVGADVRAALASWSRGDAVTGGIALLGCRPPHCPYPVDAIVVLPRGILVIAGVDLPDPAMRLDAPLAGQWKTDGWPLVRPDGAVNPAIEAMQACEAITKRLQAQRVEPLPVSTVVAVGPYVSQVFQPTSDVLRGVRIMHPEPMTLLTAVRELAVYERRCTVGQARTIIEALEPGGAGVDAATLREEGFAEAVTAAESTALIGRITDDTPNPGASRAAAPSKGNGLRWLPIAAAVLVGLLLVTGVAYAIGTAKGDGGGSPSSSAPSTSGTLAGFSAVGDYRDADCGSHATGAVSAWLKANGCASLIRMRLETTTSGHKAAVLLAVVRFANPTSASELRRISDTPGNGDVADPQTEGSPWPGGAMPAFDQGARASGVEGDSLKTARAVWLDQPSTADDQTLVDLARRALTIPVPS